MERDRSPFDPAGLGFRPLRLADLPLIYRWLNTPHVARWWYDEEVATLQDVAAKYEPRIAGQERVRCFVILYEERPIGYIQSYLIRDHPAYSAQVAVEEEAAGVDLFIGEPEYVHRGLGAPLLVAFLRQIVFADRAVESCIIGPEPKNTAAIRAYEKAGFRYLKTITVPGEPAPEYLMRMARREIVRED